MSGGSGGRGFVCLCLGLCVFVVSFCITVCPRTLSADGGTIEEQYMSSEYSYTKVYVCDCVCVCVCVCVCFCVCLCVAEVVYAHV